LATQYKIQGSTVVDKICEWAVTHVPATATQATITKAAGGANVRHVCKVISATIACGATAQTPIQIYLRDGATGVGTILWAASVAAPADGVGGVMFDSLSIMGSANTAMTLEFSAAGVTASQEVVTLAGFDIQSS
jgi:hypothetical protein